MNLPPGYHHIQLDIIDSTNLEAKRLIQTGNINAPLVITAKSQTYGKGRLNRHWVSEPGNLFVSIVMQTQEESGKSNINNTLLPFCTAIAIGNTLSKFINSKPLYKWPNDVLVQEKKISGVLIETINKYIIIGIGINITTYPTQNTKLPATCLNEHTSRDIPLTEILESLVLNLDSKIKCNNSDVINEWMQSAYGLGKKIFIQQGKKELSGIFSGIDVNGWLIFKNDKGRRNAVSFGDISYKV